MSARKRKNSGGNMRRHRALRIDALTGAPVVTRSRGIWYAHKQSRGGADISPLAHHGERNALAVRLTAYARSRDPELAELWEDAHDTGDFTRFFSAYRAGRHAMFLLAGMHLACLRRAGDEVRP